MNTNLSSTRLCSLIHQIRTKAFKPFSLFSLTLLVSLALGSSAFPQAISITNGVWSNAATWTTPPVNGASASVSGGNTVTFQAGDSYTGGYGMYTGLDVGQNYRANPGSGILNVTGGTLSTGSLVVGHEVGGTINVSGGQMSIDGGTMLFGWGASSSLNVSGSGTVTMAGTLGAAAPYFNFGHSAQSFLNISNAGTVNVQRAVSVQSGSVVAVNGAGSTLNFSGPANLNLVAGSKITAENGGNINMSGGQVTINGTEGLWLGGGGTTGTLNLSSGTWTQTGVFRLGVFASGNGVVNQTGGVFELGSNIDVWGSSPSSYNLSGGTFRLLGNYAINNYSGGSSFNITGSSGNVTMDTPYDFTVNNASTFNNAAATLTKTGSGKLTFSGSQLQIANGTLDMQAGTIETASSLAIGIGGSSATATMSGGTLKTGYIQGANFIIGYGQTGTLTQTNGTVDIGSQASTVIGWNAGGNGTYTITGGSFSGASSTYVGLGGAGTLNVNGGSYTASNMYVGGNGGTGALNLNGGTLTVNNEMSVGAGGTVNVNAGGSLSGGSGNDVTVANNGLVNFNGGTGNSLMNLKLAGGTVDVKGQTLGTNTWANLVAQTTGAVLKNSSATAASIAAGNTIWIWGAATNLTIDTTGPLQINSRITSSGQTNPTGIIKTGAGTLLLNSNLNDYTGATQVNEGTLRLDVANGLGSTSGGTTVASGAQLRLNATNSGFTVGNEALAISGQGVTTGGALRNAAGNNTYQGKITLAADATIGTAGSTTLTLDVASGNAIESVNRNLTIDGAGTTLVNDAISLGTGGLTKIGTGTTTLAAANGYSGATTVSAGTLMVDGSITSSSAVVNGGLLKVNGAAGGVTVNSGGSLGGSGTVGAVTLADGSFLKPGNSPGLLTAASSSWAGGSTYNWEINNATGAAGTNWDLFSVTGALDMSALSSGSKMNLVLESLSLANYSTSTSFSWEIAKAASLTGIADGVQDLTSLFNINAAAFNGGLAGSLPNGGFQVVTGTEGSLRTLKLMAIPEPSTGAMFVFGLVGLVGMRAFRRRHSSRQRLQD
jgi:autotransporter-associated beta strand protein